MTWNWNHPDWPHFTWDPEVSRRANQQFLQLAGESVGSLKSMDSDQITGIRIDLITDEAMQTSEIEGEYLDRDSVQSSLRKAFGLPEADRSVRPAEQGVSELMVHAYRSFRGPLTHRLLGEWHAMLMKGRSDLHDVGTYRTHADPMQVVSGSLHRPLVHFEAPPSKVVPRQMEEFVTWFNASQFDPSLTALERAGIAHLFFESIHPFEDGNGRIGRVIVEKALAQAVDRPLLLALSREIARTKKEYYRNLKLHNERLEITGWLEYFSNVVVQSQHKALELVNFIIEKTKYLDRFAPQLNDRQLKVILRMTEAGPEGFVGGLSAKNYRRIAPSSDATVTRDLSQLAELGALMKTGQLKSTRYFLSFWSGLPHEPSTHENLG